MNAITRTALATFFVWLIAGTANAQLGQPLRLYNALDPWRFIGDGREAYVPPSSTAVSGRANETFERADTFRGAMRNNMRGIGRLAIHLRRTATREEGVTWCRAWLIAPEVIITNNHCYPSNENFDPAIEVVEAQVIFGYFRPGEDQGGEILRVPAGAAHQVLEVLEENRGLDYSLLRISDTNNETDEFAGLVGSGRPIPFDPRLPLPDERLYVVQHPMSRPMQVSQFGCLSSPNPITPTSRVLEHTCQTLPGSSGSAIFAQSDNRIIGLHFGTDEGVDGTHAFNRAMLVSRIVAQSPYLRRTMGRQHPHLFPDLADSRFNVYFEWDRSNLNQAALETIDAFVEGNRQRGRAIEIIEIRGHTDRSFDDIDHQLGLSQRCANIVRDALTARGIPLDVIHVDALGAEEPARLVRGREPLNRRTEVYVVYSQTN